MTSAQRDLTSTVARPRSLPGPPARSASDSRWLWLLLAVTALLYILTLRAGQPWHDDFALYILHARNLVEGRSYADTGFLYNPAHPRYSPQMYPPGFPLMLAPVYAVFGLDFFALRLVVIASAVASVAVFVALIRPVLPPRALMAAAALVALQPFLLRFKNLLLPDFTFVLFVMLSLYLMRQLHENSEGRGRDLARAALAGCCIYVAISLRVVGVALLGALLLYHLFRRRLPSVPVLTCAVMALSLWAIQSILMPAEGGYVAQLSDIAASSGTQLQSVPLQRLRGIFNPVHVTQMFAASDVLWASEGEINAPPDAGLSRAVTVFFMFATVILASIGFLLRAKAFSVVEGFMLCYMGALLLWHASTARYFVPVIPFVLYYAVVALTVLYERGGRPTRVAVAALALLAAATYTVNLAVTETRPYAGGVTGRRAVQLYQYIGNCTAVDDRFITQRPRAITLFTGRPATSFAQTQVSEAELRGLAEGADMDGVIAAFGSDLDVLAAGMGAEFVRTFRNDGFSVYRYTGDGTQVEPPQPGC